MRKNKNGPTKIREMQDKIKHDIKMFAKKFTFVKYINT